MKSFAFSIVLVFCFNSMLFAFQSFVADTNITEKPKATIMNDKASLKTINSNTISEGVTVCPFAIILPRLTTALIEAIESPLAGDLVWNIELNCIQFFDGEVWKCLMS